jgi:hypothetical protein
MQKLSFFSRVAFVCNICFLLALALQFLRWNANNAFTSTIIILGHVVAIFVNITVNLVYLTIVVTRSRLPWTVPRWLVVANFVFVVIQIIFLLK